MARGLALQVVNLWKRYGRVVALRGLSFDVKPGEIVALVGPNGAGKTTTLRCIMGLVSVDKGEILVFGRSVLRERSKALQPVGYVPDNPILYSSLTVLEHVILSGVVHGMSPEEARESAENVLRELGIWELRDVKASRLSRGQLQKTVIAMALVHNPKLVVMDEPYSALDVEAQYKLKRLLRRFADDGVAVLVTSHIMPWVEDIADRIMVLSRGVKVFEGTIEEVKRRLGTETLEEAIVRIAGGEA